MEGPFLPQRIILKESKASSTVVRVLLHSKPEFYHDRRRSYFVQRTFRGSTKSRYELAHFVLRGTSKYGTTVAKNLEVSQIRDARFFLGVWATRSWSQYQLYAREEDLSIKFANTSPFHAFTTAVKPLTQRAAVTLTRAGEKLAIRVRVRAIFVKGDGNGENLAGAAKP